MLRLDQPRVAEPVAEPGELVALTAPTLEQLHPDEVGRWMLLFGLPMLAACVSIGLAFATAFAWFWAGAIVFGPGLGIIALIYLTLSTDTNGVDAHAPVIETSTLEPARSAASAAA